MPTTAFEEELRAARFAIDGAARLLESPSPAIVDRCAGILQSAAERIAALQAPILPPTDRSAAREEANRLRNSVWRAGRLLEGAAGFHTNWGLVRDTLCAGYTASGTPAPARFASRISLQG